MSKEQLVLDAAKDDIVLDVGGWVYWPLAREYPLDIRGFWDAEALRIIADELDRRDRVLFADLPEEAINHATGDFPGRVRE